MTTRNCLQTLVLVLLFGPMSGASHPHRPEVVSPPFSMGTCTFKVSRVEDREARNRFEVRGTPLHPQFHVKIDSNRGRARLERDKGLWPETFEMKISGRQDTLVFVKLIPDNCGEMFLHFVAGKKQVHYYDNRGNSLDQPTSNSFRIETEGTADGVDVKVTLPRSVRAMRGLEVSYWATCW